MPTLTTRQKIFQYLGKNPTATAREIALALGMTSANARRHLSILVADGRLEEFRQAPARRGRPQKAYRLSGKIKGDNLNRLVRALLEEIPARRRESELRRIGRAGLTRSFEQKHQTFAQRLTSATKCLGDMHYQARWEAGGAGPHVIFGHCPYEVVIADYPELCQMDTSLLESLLDKKVAQTAKLEKKAGGAQMCVFLVREF